MLKRLKTWLGLEPAVTTKADADAALHEISWIDHETAAVNAETEEAIASIRAEAAAKLTCKIGRKNVPFVDRRETLQAAAVAYGLGHRDALLDGQKTKTVALTHGKLAFRAQPLKVAFAEGVELDGVLDAIAEEGELTGSVKARIVESLKRIKVSEKLSAADVLSFSLSIDKKTIASKYGDDQVTADELAELGLAIEEPAETCTATPGKYEVTSASRAA